MSVIRFTPNHGAFALLGFARILLPALIYAGRQRLRAGFEAILGLALSGADRRHAPAIIYAMVSELAGFGEPLGFGRRERDCDQDQQGWDRSGEGSISGRNGSSPFLRHGLPEWMRPGSDIFGVANPGRSSQIRFRSRRADQHADAKHDRAAEHDLEHRL
jgi:hypothetical protein